MPFRTLDDTAKAFDRIGRACEAEGRAPVMLSVAQTVCVGSGDAEIARRAGIIEQDLGALRATGLAGTPAEVAEKIGRFAELGAERIYLQVLDLADLDHLNLIAEEVLPHV